MESRSPQDVVGPSDGMEPVAAADAEVCDPTPVRAVQVLSSAVRIGELSIERQTIVDYLKAIAPEKQEIALIHALEVGVTEMIARRERFRH